MRTLETEILIDAPAQTVWSILDDIARYPEWNPLVPEISGRTTVDQSLKIRLVQPGMPDLDLTPRLTRIVGARELRWVSSLPNPGELTGEHIFQLTPTDEGACRLLHTEHFDGSLVEAIWPGIDTSARAAYEAMNHALKQRAEQMRAAPVSLHPSVDQGLHHPANPFAGATLRCLCTSNPVAIRVEAPCQHNHLCACSRCWKPAGALFAQVAVVPVGTTQVLNHADKLTPVDAEQSIQRHACIDCGAHMIGRVSNPDHHFYGLDFIHPELAADAPWPAPEFAAFVSSLIETGTSPSMMNAVRRRLDQLGLEPYDSFSAELMDLIAWHRVKLAS
jgi:S-(hydroxymethyl)glutathione synthase